MTEKPQFRYHHKDVDNGVALYSHGTSIEGYFLGVKVKDGKLVMFNAVETDKPLPNEVVLEFQSYLNAMLAQPHALGIVPIIPIVHSATLSCGKWTITRVDN